ncbi:MAG TPA: hypothetical protein VFU16_08915 [Solirubrobacterales bacterium]|nr:hypothetical protein [Solirubrobacterales bacterium]
MSVLGRKEIKRRLKQGDRGCEEIFRGETWDKDCLRSAAYDLRIAKTYLITPGGTRYWPKGGPGHCKMTAPFELKPGEVAFVSTVEKLVMPADLVGNIAPRFRRALEGILVMGGMLVDPGYTGRLHFQLANVGNKPFTITPGRTSVAAIQFLPVFEASSDLDRVPSSKHLLKQLFREEVKTEPLEQLAYFSGVKDLKDEVKKLNKRIDDQEIALSSMHRSTEQLVVFGVFLVVITLFGIAIAALINSLSDGSVEEAKDTAAADLTLTSVGLAILFLTLVGVVCWLMMQPVIEIIGKRRKQPQKNSMRETGEDALG